MRGTSNKEGILQAISSNNIVLFTELLINAETTKELLQQYAERAISQDNADILAEILKLGLDVKLREKFFFQAYSSRKFSCLKIIMDNDETLDAESRISDEYIKSTLRHLMISYFKDCQCFYKVTDFFARRHGDFAFYLIAQEMSYISGGDAIIAKFLPNLSNLINDKTNVDLINLGKIVKIYHEIFLHLRYTPRTHKQFASVNLDDLDVLSPDLLKEITFYLIKHNKPRPCVNLFTTALRDNNTEIIEIFEQNRNFLEDVLEEKEYLEEYHQQVRVHLEGEANENQLTQKRNNNYFASLMQKVSSVDTITNKRLIFEELKNRENFSALRRAFHILEERYDRKHHTRKTTFILKIEENEFGIELKQTLKKKNVITTMNGQVFSENEILSLARYHKALEFLLYSPRPSQNLAETNIEEEERISSFQENLEANSKASYQSAFLS